MDESMKDIVEDKQFPGVAKIVVACLLSVAVTIGAMKKKTATEVEAAKQAAYLTGCTDAAKLIAAGNSAVSMECVNKDGRNVIAATIAMLGQTYYYDIETGNKIE